MALPKKSLLSPRLIVGLAVISVGLLLTLDNFGILEADDLIIYWPLALVAIGLTRVFHGGLPNLVFGLVFIVGGGWILMFNAGYTDVEPWSFFWPILLIVVGASLALGAMRPAVPTDADSGSTLHAFAMLGGVERQSNSPNFQGGELTAFMGGCVADLTRARISATGRPVIRVFALWGGIEIRVPPDWSVDSRVLPLMGAYEDKTRPPTASDGPRLTIRGVTIMGGIEVKSGATDHVASDSET